MKVRPRPIRPAPKIIQPGSTPVNGSSEGREGDSESFVPPVLVDGDADGTVVDPSVGTEVVGAGRVEVDPSGAEVVPDLMDVVVVSKVVVVVDNSIEVET